MMAVSFTLIWTSKTKEKVKAYTAFWLQLLFNFSWSWIFFYLRMPGTALIDIALLWTAILATIIAFWRHSQIAASLLIPYLAWVTFAAYLNGFIWLHN
jgi:translocator protein